MKHFDLSRTELDVQLFVLQNVAQLEKQIHELDQRRGALASQAGKLRSQLTAQVKEDALSVRGLHKDAPATWVEREGRIVSFDLADAPPAPLVPTPAPPPIPSPALPAPPAAQPTPTDSAGQWLPAAPASPAQSATP